LPERAEVYHGKWRFSALRFQTGTGDLPSYRERSHINETRNRIIQQLVWFNFLRIVRIIRISRNFTKPGAALFSVTLFSVTPFGV